MEDKIVVKEEKEVVPTSQRPNIYLQNNPYGQLKQTNNLLNSSSRQVISFRQGG